MNSEAICAARYNPSETGTVIERLTESPRESSANERHVRMAEIIESKCVAASGCSELRVLTWGALNNRPGFTTGPCATDYVYEAPPQFERSSLTAYRFMALDASSGFAAASNVQELSDPALPMFNIERVSLQFSISSDFVAAQVANNVLILALSTGRILRIDLENPADIDGELAL